MQQKTFQMIVSALCFIVGGLFVISNSPDITANVIGASGPEAGFVSVIGIVLLVASGAYFTMTASLDEMISTQRMARHSVNSATDHIAQEYKDEEQQKYEEKKE